MASDCNLQTTSQSASSLTPMPRLYHIHTTAGPFELMAVTAAQAVSTALELAGPGARVLRVSRQGDW